MGSAVLYLCVEAKLRSISVCAYYYCGWPDMIGSRGWLGWQHDCARDSGIGNVRR